MAKHKRLFIIQYLAANGERGIQCVEAERSEDLTPSKMKKLYLRKK